MIANEYGRLRIEGGVNSAFAPDMTAIGVSGGVSTVWGVAGPVGIEGAIHYTPYPFIDVDWNAGFVLNLSPAVLRCCSTGRFREGVPDAVHRSNAPPRLNTAVAVRAFRVARNLVSVS